ncbi:MAG: isoprenylcysteine carboxylmethyltransferase family protein [Anaerolineae bacterium]|nr:isoprenylcysteine carboxylmethyltransferase family protein [Anaerolineae bacterium]
MKNNRFRLWFLALYTVGIVILLVKIIPARVQSEDVEQEISDNRRLFPMIFLPVNWFVPAVILLGQVGEVAADWLFLRTIGLGLSVYAVVMLAWSSRVLGRFLIPQAAVFPDHVLVNSGPFRVVRHPIYSAVLALWLGAAAGTLNWLLLALWPLAALGTTMAAVAEEELLHAKFGDAYEAYARQTGRIIPKFEGWR